MLLRGGPRDAIISAMSIFPLYFRARRGRLRPRRTYSGSLTQIVTAISFLLGERIAKRIGLLKTMVFSHVPSNVFLMAVAFAPSATIAVVLLLCRHSLSQMDVPTRQPYVMSVVDESNRTAAGFTNVSRSVAQSASPSLAGYLMANFWIGSPLVVAGVLKIAYDLILYGNFRKTKPPEEQ